MIRCSSIFLASSMVYFSQAFAAQTVYCPQKYGHITIGMSKDEVVTACGQPSLKQESKTPFIQKIPTQQLIFNNQGTNRAFYGVWSLPYGDSGAKLEIDVINNKVTAVRLNGNSSNGSSICGGAMIQPGDTVQKVYNVCGTPSIVNKTYTAQAMSSEHYPEIWLYQMDPYQPSVKLTFVNDQLQSID